MQKEEDFDAAVAANGHYHVPYTPEIPGQVAWLAAATGRTVTHSHEYRTPDPHASRTVLVVGARSSGEDICRYLSGAAGWVYALDKSCQAVSTVGTCTHIPRNAEIGSDGLLSVDNMLVSGPPVDDIILSTGYQYTYPFLDLQELGMDSGADRRYIEPLWMHVVHSRRPSLSFLGVPLHVPCPIPFIEAESRLVASFLRRSTAPGPAELAEMQAWVSARRETVAARSQDMHVMDENVWPHMRELTKLSGLPDNEYEEYCRRLAVVQAIYLDRAKRRPKVPWGDDIFRRCEYSVDWAAGTWSVAVPEQSPGKL